jgi:hypothetical protein
MESGMASVWPVCDENRPNIAKWQGVYFRQRTIPPNREAAKSEAVKKQSRQKAKPS